MKERHTVICFHLTVPILYTQLHTNETFIEHLETVDSKLIFEFIFCICHRI